MKKLLPFLLLALLAACDNSSSYQIDANISTPDLDGKKVYLQKVTEVGLDKPIDSAEVKNQKLTLKGKVFDTTMYLVVFDEKISLPVFLESGKIRMDVNYTAPEESTIEGTNLNNLLEKHRLETKAVREEIKELSKRFESEMMTMTEERRNELSDQYQGLADKYASTTVDFMKANPNNVVTAYLLATSAGQGVSDEDIVEIYSKFDDNVKRSVFAKAMEETVKQLNTKSISVGDMYIDLKMKTPEGKDISISDYVGKSQYVLLDFWASWCGPCRRENPNVVALYKEFKNKGFEIVGISMDDDVAKWTAGVKEDKITWPQMSDLKKWDSEAIKSYGIKGIPFMIILDKEGKIVAKNIRGEELAKKLKELMP